MMIPNIAVIDEEDHGSIPSTQELSNEELDSNYLTDLLEKLQNGSVRKPDHFNELHFLLLLLYDSHGYVRDRYPLWRWYYRIKKRFLTLKHIQIDTDHSRQHIINAIEFIVDENATISTLIEEGVHIEEQYLHSSIHGLFQFYTPLHTYLYMEQIDAPILNKNDKIYHLFQSTIIILYKHLTCDLIHFSIAHRKTTLLDKIFDSKINWLELSVNLTTERGWLPLHYASYVGDKQTVKTICDILTTSIHFDKTSLFIPNFKQESFEKNPNEYILKLNGLEHATCTTKQRKTSRSHSIYIDTYKNLLAEQYFQQKLRSNIDLRERALLSEDIGQNSTSLPNDNDIPDADELELSSLPLIQRDEFIDKILNMTDAKQMLVPSPLVLACLAINENKNDYEDIVKVLLDSHLFEFDGLNHEFILERVLDYMHKKNYAYFQRVQVFRDTENEGPSTYIYYEFDGFIVNQDIKPISTVLSDSFATLDTLKNEESFESDDGNEVETPISIRCLLTVLVTRDIFLEYPRWDFHLLRESIEEHFTDLESALGCRPTILYPDGEVMFSRKHSNATWEVIVKYRLSSEAGESLYMQVDYYFFESFGDPFADALMNIYQTPFYASCMTDSTVMMKNIFDSFFQRRHLHRWGSIAQSHLQHCFDGVLQMKNNWTTFSSLCTILSSYYQQDGDLFIDENSAIIQRMFVHAFACCVRRNAKIELDYLIRNHALIYYDSCRARPSDIQHNVLMYCVVRNLATVFDQLMINMKTSMYKTYQNSTNPDWQPHIAWKEIVHVIIDPVLQQAQQNDFTQLACYGDMHLNITSIGNLPVLHITGEEYLRCIRSRRNIISKARKKLSRPSDSIKQSQSKMTDGRESTKKPSRHSTKIAKNQKSSIFSVQTNSNESELNENTSKKSRNIFKNVNPLRWGRRHSLIGPSKEQPHSKKRASSPTIAIKSNDIPKSIDAISLHTFNSYETVNHDEQIGMPFPAKHQYHTIHGHSYSSHRKALQHLGSIFRPIREKIYTFVDYEQTPMINRKQSSKLRRTLSVYDNEPTTKL